MSSKKRLTLLLPEGIGAVTAFKKTPRSFVRIKKGSLHHGDLLLQLTLKELIAIRGMSREVDIPHPELFQDSKSQYDDLLTELERLEMASKSTRFFDVFKRLEIRHDINTLVDAGYELYITVKSTSDKMERALLSRGSIVEEVEEGDISSNELVRGFAFTMDEAIDPLEDSVAPDHADNRFHSNNVYNIYIGCVNTDHSDARLITINNEGWGGNEPIHHPPS